ncbi:MAG TPA: GFA family protein [Actinomycetota bacterium]|nr:GFA family protein [Actinomycetota bacterium]
MQTREATCSCGQLRLSAEGDPVRISMCHCLACQRRTGSVFAVQARFPKARVKVEGRFADFVRLSDWGEQRMFHFCPDCGATVFYTTEGNEDLIAVPIGAFADPEFPQPTISVFESRKHSWVKLPDGIEHEDM